ncbi:MAG: O-antigen ligase [Alcanivorax sp.]|jgi:O-antigen ligase
MLGLAIAIPAYLGGDYSFKPVFYALVILPTLLLLPFGKVSLREIWGSAAVIFLLVVPLLYWSASNLWSTQPDNFLPFLRRSLVVFVFVVAVAHAVLRLGPDFRNYLDLALVLVAIGAALHLGSLLFMDARGAQWRLGDGSVFRRSLHASHYFGCFASYGLVRCYQQPSFRDAIPYFVSVLLCAGFVFSTESRGTIGSLLVIALLVSGLWYRRYSHAVVLLLLIGLGIYASYDALVERGMSYRMEIWQQTWPLVRDNFWGGIGLGTPLNVSYGNSLVAPHAHNLYLDLQARSGVFGLLLFLPIVVLVASRCFRPDKEEQVYLIMVLFFLLCMLTDVHKPINSPSAVFVVFWLPLAALLVTVSVAGFTKRTGSDGTIHSIG